MHTGWKSAVSFCVPPGKVLRKLPCCVDLITWVIFPNILWSVMDVHQGNTVYFMIHIIFVIVIKPQYQTYLRDNFLMIRDGDGKDAEELASSLCRYYEARNREAMLSKILQISENIWKKSVSVSADIIYMISFTEDSVKTKLKSSNPI